MLRLTLLLALLSFTHYSLFVRSSTVSAKCKNVAVLTRYRKDEATQCWPLNDGYWYGGGSEFNQDWPINRHTHEETPVIAGGNTGDQFAVSARLWLNSKGISIHVSDDVPLFVHMDPPDSDGRRLCLTAKNSHPYVEKGKYDDPPTLRYTLCRANNLTQLYLDVASMIFPKRSNPPDTQLFSSIVWSSSPALRKKEDTTTLIDYANSIVSNNFLSNGTDNLLRISEGWESCFGEFQFSSTKFPHPAQLVSDLKVKGFRVAMTVHPFVAKECEARLHAAKKHYLVVNDLDEPVFESMAGRELYSVDFGLPFQNGMIAWWMDRLKTLKLKTGFDSFSFDHGLVASLNEDAKRPLSTLSMLDYLNNYVGAAAQFGPLGIVGVATSSTQKYALFVETTKALNDYDGLASVIPTALQMGLAGYPFFVPDVVGGSQQLSEEGKRDETLYVRWLQVSIFMPVIHFSRGPWKYDDRVVEIAERLFQLREKFADKFVGLAKEAVETGSPIVRPLWWIAPTDDDALKIKNQFLIGNDLMVAPVLDNSTARSVYFPRGTNWFDPKNDTCIFGGTIQDFIVPFEQILYFTRV